VFFIVKLRVVVLGVVMLGVVVLSVVSPKKVLWHWFLDAAVNWILVDVVHPGVKVKNRFSLSLTKRPIRSGLRI